MWIADNWKDYEVIDCSKGEKLERWGDYLLVRPDPQVIWDTPKTERGWRKMNGHYHRSAKGGGEWEFFDLPQQWTIHYGKLTFNLKPFSFKHTGLFPEQAANWEWMTAAIRERKAAGRQVRILNLFGYTGGATCACAAAGAEVCHVDASKGMVTRARENVALCGLTNAKVRYLVDDAFKFVSREVRRGNRYDGIIMDPPSYGRGPGGEVWKLEDSLYGFVEEAAGLLSEEPLFFLLNSYTTGLSAMVTGNILELTVAKDRQGAVDAGDLCIPVTSNPRIVLPCGSYARFIGKEVK